MRKSHAEMKAFIDDCRSWPNWPLLPMKRIGQEGEIEGGLITPDYPTTIVRKLIWEVDAVALTIHQLQHDGEIVGPVETIRYADVDAMLDDGWVID